MKNSKFWIAGIVGGIVYFFLGWLIYDTLGMMNYMKGHMGMPAEQFYRPEANMIWWAMILSNLVWAYLTALIISWSNMGGLMGGAKVGLIFGLLIGAAVDLSYYSMSNLFTNEGMLADIAIGAALMTVGGAIMGAIIGNKGTTASA